MTEHHVIIETIVLEERKRVRAILDKTEEALIEELVKVMEDPKQTPEQQGYARRAATMIIQTFQVIEELVDESRRSKVVVDKEGRVVT